MNNIINWVRRHKWAAGGLSLLLLVLIVGTASTFSGQSETKLLTANSDYGRVAPSMAQMDMAYDEDAVGRSQDKRSEISAGMPSPMPPMEPTAGTTAAESTQRLIKTGQLHLVVGSVGDAVRAVTAYSESLGGYAEQSSVNEGANGREYGNVTVRVPVEKFEAAMSRIRDLAVTVREESVQGQDVTEQYTDLEARLGNARAQEQAYLEVLDKAESVEDILKVQQYLGNIRAQIESFEGRLQYLTNRTSLSTIHVSIEEEVSVKLPSEEFAPLEAARNAVKALIASLQGVVIALIWFGITGLGLILPALAVVLSVIWLVKRLKRNRRRKQR